MDEASEPVKVYLPLLWFQRERFRLPADLNATRAQALESIPVRAPVGWPVEACFIAAEAAESAIQRWGWERT